MKKRGNPKQNDEQSPQQSTSERVNQEVFSVQKPLSLYFGADYLPFTDVGGGAEQSSKEALLMKEE